MPKYIVCKWDPIDEPHEETENAKIGDFRWFEFASSVTKWGLRTIIRELFGRGYSDVSILVESISDQRKETYA